MTTAPLLDVRRRADDLTVNHKVVKKGVVGRRVHHLVSVLHIEHGCGLYS